MKGMAGTWLSGATCRFGSLSQLRPACSSYGDGNAAYRKVELLPEEIDRIATSR